MVDYALRIWTVMGTEARLDVAALCLLSSFGLILSGAVAQTFGPDMLTAALAGG